MKLLVCWNWLSNNWVVRRYVSLFHVFNFRIGRCSVGLESGISLHPLHYHHHFEVAIKSHNESLLVMKALRLFINFAKILLYRIHLLVAGSRERWHADHANFHEKEVNMLRQSQVVCLYLQVIVTLDKNSRVCPLANNVIRSKQLVNNKNVSKQARRKESGSKRPV